VPDSAQADGRRRLQFRHRKTKVGRRI
jgi:hypothetical protein